MMEYYSMNEYHKAIHNIEMLHSDAPICNLGGIMRFNISVDENILINAAEMFIQKNPAVRIRIDRNARIYISDEIQRVKIYSFSGSLDDNIKKLMSEPFDLYDSPLYLIGIIHISGSVLGFMKIHHILGDYSSMLVYFKEFEKLYSVIESGRTSDMTSDNRYIGTMLAPDIGMDDNAKIYFQKKLESIKGLNSFMGFDAGRSDFHADIYNYEIQPEAAEKIIRLCKKEKIRVESIFYAALAVYMKKTRGSKASVIGNIVMNRGRDSLDIFGLYANTIPLVIKMNDDFSELCKNISNDLAEGVKYSHYPINLFFKDNGLKDRCFDIAVSYISMGMMPQTDMGKPRRCFSGYIEIPLRIHIFRLKRSLSFRIEYMTALFSREFIENFTGSLMRIISCGIDNIPLEMLTKNDICAYKSLNDTVVIDSGDMTVSKLFSLYAHGHENETAFIYNGKSFDFCTAERMAGTIAGIVKGRHIAALAMGRCEYLIPAMLGVMKAGAAYMPVNPALEIPECCDIILSVSEYNIPGAVNLDNIGCSDIMTEDRSEPDKPAYYMQTSGSAGRPKIVIINNSSLYLRLKWMHDRYGLNKRILQKTNNTFDVSGWELLAPAFGGISVIMKNNEEKDPEKIIEYIRKYNIHIIHFVPSAMNVFLTVANRICEIQRIFFSGEALAAETVRRARNVFPDASIHNLYGPTECTIDVSYYDCTGSETEIPIGKPVSDTKLYVINSENEIMPRGVTGELVITGGLVGAGYLDNCGGYTNIRGKYAYKTGDLCCLGFDGNLYFKGRGDTQVKINGKRVDLNGLYHICMEMDGMENCAAVYENGKVYLFCISDKNAGEIRTYLSRKTDRIPSHIFCVDKIPLTSSGKTDRTELAKLLVNEKNEKPQNPDEQFIHDEILSLLNKDGELYKSIDVNEDIFNIGIDSLSVIELIENFKKYGYNFEARDFYEYPTVKMLASTAMRSDKRCGSLVFLKRCPQDHIICCFPYAGGHPYSFRNIADSSDADTAAVDYSYFDESCGVENIAENIASQLMSYERITLVSICIGSAFALETAYLLDKAGHSADEVYMIAALPSGSPNGINIWRGLSKKALLRILSNRSGKALPRGMSFENFLRDTDRYFKYMHENTEKKEIRAPLYLAFGCRDRFTRGYRKKYRLWERYFKEKLILTEFDTENHYFFEEIENLLEKIKGDNIID